MKVYKILEKSKVKTLKRVHLKVCRTSKKTSQRIEKDSQIF